MAVTLADREHTGNYPRRINPRKIMLSFGAIISATSLEIEGTHPNDQHHRICQDQELDAGEQEFGRPKNFTQTEGNKTKKWQTAHESRPCFRSNWQAFLESYIIVIIIKDVPTYQRSRLSVSPTTYVNRWSASEYSWCVHCATPVQHNRPLGLSTSKHKSTPMICINHWSLHQER